MQVRRKKLPEKEKDIYAQITDYINTLYELCELNHVYYHPSTGETDTIPSDTYEIEKLVWSFPEAYEIYDYITSDAVNYKGNRIRKDEYYDFLIDLHEEEQNKKRGKKHGKRKV